MVGGMHDMGGGCARQEGVRGGGYVWQGSVEGVCVVGDVRAGETATKAGGTHPTLMHSCFDYVCLGFLVPNLQTM